MYRLRKRKKSRASCLLELLVSSGNTIQISYRYPRGLDDRKTTSSLKEKKYMTQFYNTATMLLVLGLVLKAISIWQRSQQIKLYRIRIQQKVSELETKKISESLYL